MSNLLHMLLAATWGFALVAGGWTLATKVWLDRRLGRLQHPAEFDRSAVFAALVLPGLWPGVWFVSALWHLEETHALMDACCSLLAGGSTSWQNWVFGTGAAVVVASQAYSLWRRWRNRHRRHRETSNHRAEQRVRRICRDHQHLARLTDRVRVVDCEAHVCATVGLFKQRIEIAESLVEQLDDAALEAALLHEAAHFSLRDPARQFVLLVTRILNPFSWLLSRESAAWRFAREIECDRRAVECGARPVAIADALVTTARAVSNAPRAACARFCGERADALSARVRLLLDGALPERNPTDSTRAPTLGFILLTAGFLVPHLVDGGLVAVHCLLERLLHGLTLLV